MQLSIFKLFPLPQEDQDGSQGVGKRKRVKLSSTTKGIYKVMISVYHSCFVFILKYLRILIHFSSTGGAACDIDIKHKGMSTDLEEQQVNEFLTAAHDGASATNSVFRAYGLCCDLPFARELVTKYSIVTV